MSDKPQENKGKGQEPKKVIVELLPSKDVKSGHLSHDPVKSETFEIYVLWKSLPPLLKMPPRHRKTGERPDPREFAEDMGIDDEVILRLVELPRQQDFAREYNVAQETLSDWNKRIGERDYFKDARTWMNKLVPNILMSMYNNGLSTRNLNADRDRLNFVKITGYVEKTEQQHTFHGLYDQLRGELEDERKLTEAHEHTPTESAQ